MIKITNLSYNYPDKTRALAELNLTISKGENVALLGANGAGKSTLLGLLSGAIMAHDGLEIDNLSWGHGNTFILRQKVGMIFQRPDDQLLAYSVEEDIAFGPRNLGLSEDVVSERVETTLSQLNIVSLRSRSPQRLSEGEKRLAAIAGVLAMEPELLLFDEPTSQLDPRAKRELVETLKELPQTKIIATHDLDFAQKLCPRAIILNHGRIVYDGDFAEIIAKTSLMEEYSLA